MFRLIKLAMYAFVGYSLYQLYQGMMQQQQGTGAFSGGGSERGSARSRGQNLTGAGAGRTEETLDNDGGSVRHNVGRGVIST